MAGNPRNGRPYRELASEMVSMDDCGIIPVTGAPGLHFLWERRGRVITLTSVLNAPPPPTLWRPSLPSARRDEDR
ncbi:hypothetical protein GCM10017667_00290 [Streptomyces filamentosus]|uniref:Uncharacterized protein n=1 Tax=Streptomyces filamentosus TaxID=67294 RepID=A0A919BB12_STRFL|nr:hypothetical protein GCM10017667_00290 [Streptomyces filamentosus]